MSIRSQAGVTTLEDRGYRDVDGIRATDVKRAGDVIRARVAVRADSPLALCRE